MFIQLTALRVSDYGEEKCGRLVVRKDQIAAIHNSMAYNFDSTTGLRQKGGYYRGGAVVHLTSGKAFHVQEQFTDVKALLME